MPEADQPTESQPPDGAEPMELFELDEYVDSFNWRIVIGAVFVGLIMLPGAIYMGLVTGQSLAGAAEWVTIILFIEIGKRSFVRMSKQEVIILFGAAAGLVSMGAKLGSAVNLFGGPFGGMIWDQYLVQSQQAENLGIADKIPWWLVPKDQSVLQARSFLHYAWAFPIVLLCTHAILSVVVNLSLGYMMYRVTNDIERLPFPLAPVFASGATALAETSQKKETWRWRVFSIGAVVGIGFGLIYVVLPTITGAFSPKAFMILPIPFGDLTAAIGNYLPAAVLGYGFDLTLVMIGFILPFRLVVGMFISSIFFQVLLNPVLYKYGILRQWSSGFSVIPTSVVNGLDFYISFGIGVAVGVAAIGIFGIARVFLRGKREFESDESDEHFWRRMRGRGEFSFLWAFVIWASAILIYVGICYVLTSDFGRKEPFPLWILLVFGFVISPLLTYIRTRMVGITGQTTGANFPYIREAAFILSDYKGVDIWFAPVPLFMSGIEAQNYKQCELTRTKFIAKVKQAAVTTILLLACSFLYWSVIWRLAPIPSGAYPFVQKMWPLHAYGQSIWASSTLGSHTATSDLADDPIELEPILPKQGSSSIPLDGYIGRIVYVGPQSIDAIDSDSIVVVAADDQQALDRIREVAPPVVVLVAQSDNPDVRLARLEGMAVARQAAQKLVPTIAAYWCNNEAADELEILRKLVADVTVKPRKNFLLAAINGTYIGSGTVLTMVLFGTLSLFGLHATLFYGLIGGFAQWPHFVLPQLVGALLGKYYLSRKLGPDRWRNYSPVLLAGYSCGFGLIAMVSIGITLIGKAISAVIF